MMSCRLRKPPFRRNPRFPARRSSLHRRLRQRSRDGNAVESGRLFVNRLLIVDGHAYAYRAFYAIRELRSPAGLPTNAIYGFVKMLAKMRESVGPTHLMVVWDGGLSAERV